MKNNVNSVINRYPSVIFISVFVTFVTIESLFSFCTTVECPAFYDEHFDAWFPYEQDQVLYFQTADNKRDTITITEVRKSEKSTEYSTMDCWMNAYVVSLSKERYEFDVSYLRRTDMKRLDISLYGSKFVANDLTENGPDFTSIGDYSITASPSLSINGTTFNDVLAVEVDSVSNPQARLRYPTVRKIWLAKQQGLIAFEKYPSDGVWVKR